MFYSLCGSDTNWHKWPRLTKQHNCTSTTPFVCCLVLIPCVAMIFVLGMQLTSYSVRSFGGGEQRSRPTPKSPGVCWPSRGSKVQYISQVSSILASTDAAHVNLHISLWTQKGFINFLSNTYDVRHLYWATLIVLIWCLIFVHSLCSEAKCLHVFRYGDNLGRTRTNQHKGAGFFFSGVLTALTCVAVSI